MGMNDPVKSHASLFAPGVIRPSGWLKRQLEIQASGLSGHLDEFWPDIRDSGWIGGSAEGWERAPYWLDGIVPLAFLLGDEGLIRKVDRWVGYIVSHQGDDGWLGPYEPVQQGHRMERDPWPLFIVFKALTQYAMATGEDSPGSRVFDAIVRALRAINSDLDNRPLYDWGKYRWGDLLLTILWTRLRTQEDFMDELAERVHFQGYNWKSHYERFPFPDRSDRWTFERHGVNNAMGIKAPALWQLYVSGIVEKDAFKSIINILDKYHGQATGVFSGDESLAGRMPSQGTELCAVVEYMYSLEMILPHQADVALSDRLERVAFNALPATFSADMWAHQYDQQVNQAQCVVTEKPIYTTNGPDANLYGLEPHFGCCTANMHQGFPKFATSLWHRTASGAIRAVSYAPCKVVLTARELSGSPESAHAGVSGAANGPAGSLAISVGGNYPLTEFVEIAIVGEGALCRQPHELVLPVPEWAADATVSLDGEKARRVDAGSHVRMARSWEGEHRIELHLPMTVRVEFRYNHAAAISCGPLLFGFQPQERWEHERGEHPHSDWRVTPRTPWNVAIALPGGDGCGLTVEREAASVSGLTNLTDNGPLSAMGEADRQESRPAPIRIRVRYRELTSWGLNHGAAAAPPESPVDPAALGSVERTGYLVPYAGSGLRIAEIPWYNAVP